MEKSTNRRDLVLTSSVNFGAPELMPLVRSLRACGFDGDVVVFQQGMQPADINILQAEGVTCKDLKIKHPGLVNSRARFWKYIRPILQLPIPFSAKKAVLYRLTHYMYVRFLNYHDYLVSAGPYRRVFLTDARDVVFQSNLFERDPGDQIEGFLERKDSTIGRCSLNREWLDSIIGPTSAGPFMSKPIVCAGTLYGNAPLMIAFLRKFIEEHFKLLQLHKNGDQALVNYMVHNDSGIQARLIPNESGVVFTMSQNRNEFIWADGEQQWPIRSSAGEAYAVLHQYDRFPSLKAFIEQKFGCV